MLVRDLLSSALNDLPAFYCCKTLGIKKKMKLKGGNKTLFATHCYRLARFRANLQPKKNSTPKPTRAIKDSQGKDCNKAAARRHSVECVSGKT